MSSANPYESPDTAEQLPESRPSQYKHSLIGCLLILGFVVILIGLMLPAVRVSREPARRAQCSNNLKIIALALQNYEATYKSLPPAYTVDATGKRLHSWRTLILPFLEQEALYEKIDLSKPWDDPANKEASETVVSIYQCPSAGMEPTQTTYLAVVGPNSCFHEAKPRRFSDITDDRDVTMMVIDVASKQAIPWMSPHDATEEMVFSLGSSDSLPHAYGTHAAFTDGSIHFLNANTKSETLRALISINGNDNAVAREID